MISEETLVEEITAAQPSIRTRHGKVAFAVHATFVAAGYVLHATSRSLFFGAEFLAYSTAVMVDNWNEFEDDCGFIYSNPERGSKRVVVNCRVKYDNLLVAVFGEDFVETLHHEVYVPEYVDQTDFGSSFKNLGKLVAYVKREIISKLDGDSSSATSCSQPSRPELIFVDDTYDAYDLLHNCYTRQPSPRYNAPTIHDSQPDLFELVQPISDERLFNMMLHELGMRDSMGGYMPDEESLMYTGDSTGDSMPDEESLMCTGDSSRDYIPEVKQLIQNNLKSESK